MAEILITSGLAFAGTNMDDILILMILFAAAGSSAAKDTNYKWASLRLSSKK